MPDNTEMEPEDGCLWVYGPDQDQTIAFTPFSLENLKDLIKHYKANPHTLRHSTRGAHRMRTTHPVSAAGAVAIAA
ncbi:hypothetical protein C0V82_26420 (plasmid) [Niveispirillum cyanobacteriorum]|uniref:Uncharacterized protein n=1 Tax=Niveispirillum cyanobacteriorum TaxID=1612173 RepID=A0A2K9NLJ9_9PROT|nr:hypothetical protein C0V82_26420 [Niveispirillum cyanobacteriorum]GGE86281.1 hypothetical protein GCM10011317_49290 [Niveispirillum cyanobacteriorum]